MYIYFNFNLDILYLYIYLSVYMIVIPGGKDGVPTPRALCHDQMGVTRCFPDL